MPSRLPAGVLWIIVAIFAFWGISQAAIRLDNYNKKAEVIQSDSVYLNETVGTLQDGKPITRKMLIDFMIRKEIERVKQSVEKPNGR
jgi:hypothetical protein